jgi:RimJ/RimL family protein N-acetyltransferase
MKALTTQRLNLRVLDHGDADFILELLNEPGFLRYIGDKGVRSLEDARNYLDQGPMDSYRRHGFGLLAVCLPDRTPLGICGLVKREGLEDPDIGFAFLERHWSKGYATESAAAVLDQARNVLKLGRIVAITSLDNAGSAAVLNKLGLHFERVIRLRDNDELRLFS